MERTSNLVTLGAGAACELFDRELAAVLENISDINTPDSKERKLTLEFTFKPFPDRKGALVNIQCKSSLAPANHATTSIFVVREGSKLTIAENDPRQTRMFDQAQGSTQ